MRDPNEQGVRELAELIESKADEWFWSETTTELRTVFIAREIMRAGWWKDEGSSENRRIEAWRRASPSSNLHDTSCKPECGNVSHYPTGWPEE